MTKNSSNNELVRVGQQTIARYSGALVKRSLEELKTIAPSTIASLQKHKRALLVHARDQYPEFITGLLREAGMAVDLVECYNEEHFDDIMKKLASGQYDLVVPTNLGLSPWYIPKLVSTTKQVCPKTKIIVISGHLDLPIAIDLKKRGMDDCVSLPYDQEDLLHTIKRVMAE